MGKEFYSDLYFVPERDGGENRRQIDSIDDVLQLEQQNPFRNALRDFEEKIGRPFETIPFIQKEHFLVNRLDELVRVTRVNSLHKENLDKAGVSEVRDLSDFHKIPITTRNDVNALYTQTKSGLVIPFGHPSDHSGHKVIASGGSSGEPILAIYRNQELRDIGERAGKFLRRNIVGYGEPATFLNLFDNQNGWASNELVQNILEGVPGGNTIPAGVITLPRVADFFLRQGVTDVAGLPSNFSHLVHLIDDAYPHTTYPNVVRAIYGGEFMDPTIRDQVKKMFPNVQLVSAYSSTQADFMAVQVEEEDDFLRIADDINFLEIVDDDGQPVPYGQTGRIIVTRLMGNGDQPLRLDLQDKGSIELPDPSDPLQARKLKLYGRSGDYLRVSTWDIKASDLLTTSHTVLKGIISTEGVQARQLLVDATGVHLKLAVADPAHYPILTGELQFDLMHTAVMQATGFFEDPHDFPPSTKLTVEFVAMKDLERAPSGKIHPFVNKRGEEKK